jgi:hypothetical protein
MGEESPYNNGMTNELELKLHTVKRDIISLENDEPINEMVIEDFKNGYLAALYEMKEWLEGMVANFE